MDKINGEGLSQLADNAYMVLLGKEGRWVAVVASHVIAVVQWDGYTELTLSTKERVLVQQAFRDVLKALGPRREGPYREAGV